MIPTVRDRATFDALRREGRRATSGPVWIRHLPRTSDESVTVAFAIGRRVGGAVTRNRVRRRLRVILDELHRAGHIPPGAYLVGVAPGADQLSFTELGQRVGQTLERLEARR